jgi:hypothetical protein
MKVLKNSISVENIATLKNIVKIKLDRDVVSHSDCIYLAEEVLAKTDRRIGITTFRRFFDIDESKNLPSAYTLDTLCLFCGYNSWFDFVSSNRNKRIIEDEEISTQSISWETVKEKASSISRISIRSTQKKSGINYNYTINRKSINEHIINFLTTPFSATAFVAPSGYGKSIGLLRAIETLFISPDAKYNNDIIWYIDASMISGLIAKGFDLARWLASQMGFDDQENFKEFFALHPEQRKGKMILIIDSLDQITDRANKLNEILESILMLIALNDESPWFKVILTMRCSTWNKVQLLSSNTPLIKSQWYQVGFHTHAKSFINVPLLTNSEKTRIMLNVMKKSNNTSKIEKVRQQVLSRDFYDYLCLPIFMQIYLKKLSLSEEPLTTPVELLVEFYKEYISMGKYGEEKQLIIDSFLNLIDMGYKDSSIRKKELLATIDSRFAEKAYEELVSIGIFSEENHYNKFGTQTTHVAIEYPLFLSFLIAVKVFLFFDEPSILNYKYFLYSFRIKSLKTITFKWLIYFAFYIKDYDLVFGFNELIKHLDYQNEEYDSRDNPFINEIINTIGLCLRHDSEAREQLLERLAADILWQKYYFEAFLDHDHVTSYYGDAAFKYLKYRQDIKGRMYCHIIQLHRYTLLMDFEKAHFHLEILDSIDPYDAINEPYHLAISISFKTIYFHVFYHRIPSSCFEILLKMIDELPVSIGNYRFAIYISLISVVANYSNNYFYTMQLWQKVHIRYSNIKNKRQIIPEDYLLMILVAEAYIETGNLKDGKELLSQFKISEIDNHKQTFRFVYDIALAKYYYYSGTFEKAYSIIEEDIDITELLGISFYSIRIKEIKDSLRKSIKVANKRFRDTAPHAN